MPTTLTTLPLEVRNEIYSFVFDYGHLTVRDDDPGCLLRTFRYEYSYSGSHPWGKHFYPQQILALLSVSQQLSDEAAAYFYGKTIFRGTWPLIAAFIKGIGAQRRNMIRRVEIDWGQSLFKGGEDLDMLAELTSLRTVHIYALKSHFKRLQKKSIPGCILGLAGKVDIAIFVNINGDGLSDTIPPLYTVYSDEYTWSCARNTAQWTGGEPIRILSIQ